MHPTISKVRQNLFALVEDAARGEKVEFVHKGQTFQIVPVDRTPSKLARIKPLDVLPMATTIDDLLAAQNGMCQEVMDAWGQNNRP